MIKKKINVIPPTLRMKKRYVILTVSKLPTTNQVELIKLIISNFESIFGIFKSINASIILVSFSLDKKEIGLRVNKDNLDDLLTSFLFLEKDFGIISIKVAQTIKKSKL